MLAGGLEGLQGQIKGGRGEVAWETAERANRCSAMAAAPLLRIAVASSAWPM